MSGPGALRVAVAGALGAVGCQLLEELERRRFPVAELVAWSGEGSEGAVVDFRDDPVMAERAPERFDGLDLLFLCTPRDASRGLARRALASRVPCLDLSGAFAGADEVPRWLPGDAPEPATTAPLVSVIGGVTLAWALVLRPLARAAGIERVVGTGLESAIRGGRRGVDALSLETAALLNQQEIEPPPVFPWPVAFDCQPGAPGRSDPAPGASPSEAESRVARELAAVLGGVPQMDVSLVRVPVFTGECASLWIELERELSPEEATGLLEKSPGVALAHSDGADLRTRAVTGSEFVRVGHVRGAGARGLRLWLAADAPRLVVSSALELAEARFARA